MTKPLTIEQSAAVIAMMQRLVHRAETGEDADEHTIALRMLGAAYKGPENTISLIQSTSPASMPVAFAAPRAAEANRSSGDDKFNQLTALLMGDTKTPGQQVGSGTLPKAPVVTILPNYTNQDVQSNYASLMDASSLCQLYVNLLQAQDNPKGFNITDPAQATKAFAAQAQYTYNAMIGPLAGFFIFKEGTARPFNNKINRNDIHGDFLGKIFEAYQFDDATISSLDNILTNFVDALKTVNPGGDPNTQDFCLRLNLCPRRNVSGVDKDPIWVYQPTTYLIYMKIAGRTYSESVSKNNSVDKVDFSFNLTTTKCELNVRQFEANRDRFNKIFELVTDMNLREYSDLLNKKITSKQENPGAGA